MSDAIAEFAGAELEGERFMMAQSLARKGLKPTDYIFMEHGEKLPVFYFESSRHDPMREVGNYHDRYDWGSDGTREITHGLSRRGFRKHAALISDASYAFEVVTSEEFGVKLGVLVLWPDCDIEQVARAMQSALQPRK